MWPDYVSFFCCDSDAIDDPGVTYAHVEEEDSGSEQVSTGTAEVLGQQHLSLIAQDGTQQVNQANHL